ncbi:hypothetical protein AB8B21_18270 [Tardiphaga sp. 866_E4_N2_1]|uniref:hypothetical protein n=1 Tax=unclassified Tardiphaga TaxID=2631404 RepID=UPI003F29EDBD
MTSDDPAAKLRELTESGKLRDDRLREAQAVLSRQVQHEEAERKRKHYGRQLIVVFLVVICVLGGGAWAVKKLLGAHTVLTPSINNSR